MKDWDATKIIVIGLVVMGEVSVLGYYICMMMGMNPTIEPTISIITGLFSAIGVVTGTAISKERKPAAGQRQAQEPQNRESGSYGDARTKMDANLDTMDIERKD